MDQGPAKINDWSCGINRYAGKEGEMLAAVGVGS